MGCVWSGFDSRLPDFFNFRLKSKMKSFFKKFFAWYERHYTINLGIAATLFVWQLIHLYWLTAHVVALKIFGTSFFQLTNLWQIIITLVDYTEIPAIIITSLVYINDLHKSFRFKSLLYLAFLNSQWLHIFWITDEFVIGQFSQTASSSILPIWLAYIAIIIDYFELPVIYDTVKKFLIALLKKYN